MKQYFTPAVNFYKGTDPKSLIEQYGSPLYVYSEAILRARCKEMKQLVNYNKFVPHYSIKANSNLHLLNIVHEEGLHADAMSPGEIFVLQQAGFTSDEIFYVCNNVSVEEMKYAVDRDITVSIDSLSQLEMFCEAFPGAKVAVRFNTGYGAGHHEKVVTAGKKTKFGINDNRIDEVKNILDKYNMKLTGINQHIGSLFLEETAYVASAELLCKLAMQFEDLEFIDFGGGFGIPYMKQDSQGRLDLSPVGEKLLAVIEEFVEQYGKEIRFSIEPGRYISAECCVLLGTVHALKYHAGIDYVGTDLGFNVLQRPVMYDAHHDIEIYTDGELQTKGMETVTIVGNICESGDKLAIGRTLPNIKHSDIIGVMDAGAYGYSMASNYNNRLRPAEVLITSSGETKVIRRRDTLEDLVRGF
jgi:diaminopimelate decarboxylase